MRLMLMDAVLCKEFHPPPPVPFREYGVFVIGGGEESFCQRTVGDQANVQFLQHRKQILRIPLQHGIDILDRRHRTNRMGTANDVLRHRREAPMQDSPPGSAGP